MLFILVNMPILKNQPYLQVQQAILGYLKLLTCYILILALFYSQLKGLNFQRQAQNYTL